MKRIIQTIMLLGLFVCLDLNSAPLVNIPTQLIQPDGNKIDAFFSGDEFYHYCHDEKGYTILPNSDGWFTYAQAVNQKVVSTNYRVGETDPRTTNLTPNLKISKEEYLAKKSQWKSAGEVVKAPHTGPLNTLCIFIKFNDQVEFQAPRSSYITKFNSTTAASLKSYYKDVSYNKLDITTHFFPICGETVNLSYTDNHPRSYYVNPPSVAEARLREHALIKNAVESIAQQAAGVDFDMDDDGFVDNLCIITRGQTEGWADVGLWPHTGVADSYDIRVNGARIFNYEFQFESYVDYGVLAHEMFHILGAPDLYHYTDNPISSVGTWDIMAGGRAHMGAYMKYRYANQKWITDIPEITQSGTYSLKPLYRSQNNCYKIRSPYTDSEFFVLEYRKKSGLIEGDLFKSGLLVYRINPSGDNAYSPPDQVYIFRPNGTLSNSGDDVNAVFSANSGRTAINDFNTNPKSFLTDGSPGGLFISNIGTADTTISFSVSIPGCNINSPADSTIFASNQTIPVSVDAMDKGFSKVELYLNNNLLTTMQTAPYNYSLIINESGEYNLRAKAYSTTGIVATDIKTIFVSKDKPFVFFVNPVSTQQYSNSESIKALVKAGYPGHNLTKAEFYLDDQLINTVTQEPYSVSLTIPTAGTHTIKAKVYADQVYGQAEKTINVSQLLLSESFEGTWPPAGWSVNTPVYGWYRTDKIGRTGTHSAAVRHYHAQGVAILETPQVTLGSEDKIEFYWMDRDADITKVIGLDTTYFEIFADNQWQTLGFNSAENFQTAFVKSEYNLSPYSNKSVKFRWRDVTNESIYTQGCILDDVKIGKGLVSITDSQPLPDQLSIRNYPNPFNNSTIFNYSMPSDAQITISIYNAKGEMVEQLYNGNQLRGNHNLKFNGDRLNSGVYFCRLSAGNNVKNLKLLLIK